MTNRDGIRSPDDLSNLAEIWAEECLDSFFYEYSAWDVAIEDGILTEEEWEWIKDNITFDINAICDSRRKARTTR